MPMQLDEVRRLTALHGEGWALAHAERVLALVEPIAGGMAYDREALAYAAYLHDWAALAPWGGATADHAARSAQLAREQVLPQTDLSAARQELVAAAIAYHDYRDERVPPTPEALLLREADLLDMLGVIGVAREFSWGPRDLAIVAARIRRKGEIILARLTLPLAQALAAERWVQSQWALAALERDSLGYL